MGILQNLGTIFGANALKKSNLPNLYSNIGRLPLFQRCKTILELCPYLGWFLYGSFKLRTAWISTNFQYTRGIIYHTQYCGKAREWRHHIFILDGDIEKAYDSCEHKHVVGDLLAKNCPRDLTAAMARGWVGQVKFKLGGDYHQTCSQK